MDKNATLRLLLTNSFVNFVKYFWDVIELEPLQWGKHLDAMCLHLQALAEGKILNLLINLPPRCSKSKVCSELYPVWLWLRDPTHRVLSGSYGMNLAEELAYSSKKLIESEKFRSLFPYLAINPAVSTKGHYENMNGGKRRAVSVGSATTGFNATFVIVDDLHKIKERESEAERKAAIDYFSQDLTSRAILTRRVPVLVIGQRVHATDVSGFIIDNFKGDPAWSFLVLPMEYQPEREELPNALGWHDWRTQADEILWEGVITPEFLKTKKILHRHDYPCLYNQDTINRAGDLFKTEWFRTYEDLEGAYVTDKRTIRKSACVRVQMVDVAVTTSGSSDYTVCMTADLNCGDVFIVDVFRKKLDGNRLIPTLKQVYDTYKPAFMGVEKAGQQALIISQLRGAGVVVRAVSPEGKDKEIRSIPAQIKCEAGQVYWKKGAEWINELEAELLSFPRGRHDDQVDALSYLVLLAQRYDRSSPEPTEEELAERQEKERQEAFQSFLWAGVES